MAINDQPDVLCRRQLVAVNFTDEVVFGSQRLAARPAGARAGHTDGQVATFIAPIAVLGHSTTNQTCLSIMDSRLAILAPELRCSRTAAAL